MNEEWSKWLIVAGLTLLVVGLGFRYFGKYLSWIGNLPGDIKVEKENFKLYFPLTTMILFSIILNLIIRGIRNLS